MDSTGRQPGARGAPIAIVRANGLDVGYDVHGSGPPLILLHGASSSGREDFAAQIPLFSKAFRLYLPDARGHATTRWHSAPGVGSDPAPAGASGPAPGLESDAAAGLRSDDLVADLLAFADALHLATFHLLGFSMGGRTALRFATRYPDRLRTLVVIGYSVEREPRTSVARRVLDPERIERDDPSWAAELERRHAPIQGSGAWRGLLESVVADVVRQPAIDLSTLRSIELPALIVTGDRDPFTPVGQAWTLQRQLPDARLLVVPGTGHQVASQRPGIFNEALGSFYRSTESAARRRSAPRASEDEGRLAHPGTERDD